MLVPVRTRHGQEIDLEDLKLEEITLNEIAHALSMICRFGGRIDEFYSVAQHSAIVANLIYAEYDNSNLALCGLFHDAAEAYVGDTVTPIKRKLSYYKGLEERVLARILKKYFLFDVYEYSFVKKYDIQAYDAEEAYFYGKAKTILGWYPTNPEVANIDFMDAYYRYVLKRK